MVMLDAHLSFTDDEEGVSSGSLSNDVLSISVMCLSGEKATEERLEFAPFSHPHTNLHKNEPQSTNATVVILGRLAATLCRLQ